MNSLIYHTALLVEGLCKRLARLDARTVLGALAIGVPLLLLVFVTLRFSDSVARLTLAILGSGGIALSLAVIITVAAAGAALFLRGTRPGKEPVDTGGTGAQA